MNRWLILAATAACLGVLSPVAFARPTHRHSKATGPACPGKSCQAPGHTTTPSSTGTSHSQAGAHRKNATHHKSGTHAKSGTHGKSNHDGPGDSNAGDVWLDNVGQPAGPGHEMDPHLSCTDINLWGDKLADATGSYTIDGWPPSGHKQQAYSGTWNYDQSQGGVQVLDVINVQTLINNAMANGDTPNPQQGFHFKLQFSQDPQKHKVFWVKCASSTAPPPPSGETVPGTTPTGTAPTTTTSGTAPSSTSGTAPAQSGVKGERISGSRHHRASKRSRRARARRPHRAAGFTG